MKVFIQGISILLLGFVLLVVQLDAREPPGSLKSGVRDSLAKNLAKEGYMAHFEHGQGFKRGVSAYLWDNRYMLRHVDFHSARQTDALICVMIRKGYGNFSEYTGDKGFMDLCSMLLK